MAKLKSINKYASAPLAPNPLPAGALMLVEIDGNVYRINPSAVGGGGAALPDWVTNMPTAAGDSGTVYNDNGVLKVSP